MKKQIALVLTLASLFISQVFAAANDTFTSARASQAEYFTGCREYEPEEEKLFTYPILLEWEGNFVQEGSFNILFSKEKDSSFTKIASIAKTEPHCFVHEVKDAKPLEKYYYRISFVSPAGKTITDTAVLEGWPALSPTLYFIAFNKAIIYSHSKLTLMHKPNIFDKMGKEKIKGDLSGTLSYETKVQGFSGVVPMKYTNYSDSEDWIFNGTMTTKANIYGNGKMINTILVKGMYPGKVSYENVEIKKQKAGGGYYLVEPAGYEATAIDYTYNFYGESK